MDDDEFYSIRTAYYIGDYTAVVKESKNLSQLRGIKGKERDSLLCRAYIAQKKFRKAQSVAGKSVATPMLAVKQLLIYAQASNPETKELVIEQLKEYAKEDAEITHNVTFSVVAAQVFCNEGMFKQALELVVNGQSLQQLLMACDIYLKINRPELAAKTVSKMREMEDDDALTSLATAGLCLFHGGKEKVNECLEILEDLQSQATNSETILLKNMQAVAQMHLQNFTQAWKYCRQAKEISKTGGFEMSETTLVNSIVCLQHLTKGQEILPRLHSELRRISPEHPFLSEMELMSKAFDRAAENFST